MTSTAPRKPATAVDSDAQPKLTTKSGIASGTTISTAHTRRPGRSVRSVSHAAPVPMTAHTAVTATASRTVFHSSWPVRGRAINAATWPAPAPRASVSRNASGTMTTAATRTLTAISAPGRPQWRRRRAVRRHRLGGAAATGTAAAPDGRCPVPATWVTASRPCAAARWRWCRRPVQGW